jgi:hypothetical protein
MALPTDRPVKEAELTCNSASIATSVVPATTIAAKSGVVARVMAAAGGTTTGTITVSVTINAGSDITGGGLTIAAGSNARAGSIQEFGQTGTSSGVTVQEGDCITFTPSGGTGTSIPGSFCMVVR